MGIPPRCAASGASRGLPAHPQLSKGLDSREKERYTKRKHPAAAAWIHKTKSNKCDDGEYDSFAGASESRRKVRGGARKDSAVPRAASLNALLSVREDGGPPLPWDSIRRRDPADTASGYGIPHINKSGTAEANRLSSLASAGGGGFFHA